MRSLDVQVPAFNTTFMGMAKGAATSLGIVANDALLYGASGHAFVMYVHESLCPSGPYCFDRQPLFRLLRNLGLEVSDLGFFASEATPTQRAAVDARLKEEIDSGRPAGLINMEFQLVTGYDETGFLTAQPWACNDFPPKRLSFGTWDEFGGEVHANFFTFARCSEAERNTSIRESLDFAVSLYDAPARYAGSGYGMGPDAYRMWKAAIPEHGASHGNWWNATVWGECRQRAGEYLREVALFTGLPLASELAEPYAEVGSLLQRVSEKELPGPDKIALLEKAERLEADATKGLRQLARDLPTKMAPSPQASLA